MSQTGPTCKSPFVVQFDHHPAEFAKDPWPELEALRTDCPVAYSEN